MFIEKHQQSYVEFSNDSWISQVQIRFILRISMIIVLLSNTIKCPGRLAKHVALHIINQQHKSEIHYCEQQTKVLYIYMPHNVKQNTIPFFVQAAFCSFFLELQQAGLSLATAS